MTDSKTQGYEEVFKGAEDVGLDVSDMASGTQFTGTKKFRICQRKSDNDEVAENAGKFRTKDEDGNLVIVPHLEGVWLDMSPFRVLYNDDGFVCGSSNAQTADLDSNKKCDTCPTRVACKFGVRVLMAPTEEDPEGEPFILECTSTGWGPVKDAAREIQTKYKRPVFSAVWKITTTKYEGKFGMNHIPVLKPIRALGKEFTDLYRSRRAAEFHRLKGRNQQNEEDVTPDMIGEMFGGGVEVDE